MARTFTLQDQLDFAVLSGDYNPLHIDPIASRRSIFGAPVVHGIHAFLWTLDGFLEKRQTAIRLTSAQVTFRRPVPVGEDVESRVSHDEEGKASIELHANNSIAMQIDLTWDRGWSVDAPVFFSSSPPRQECRVVSADNAAAAEGNVPLHLHVETGRRLFPQCERFLPHVQFAQFLATTRLVGMECPGLNSVYSKLDLTFSAEVAANSTLAYRVTSFDDRFGLMSIAVSSIGMKGTVTAFLRPAPQEQARYVDLKRLVTPDEFASQFALVVGGTRGLGETTAKLLAAGGAQVSITYHTGEQDARRVVEEIESGGGVARSFQLNVLDPTASRDLKKENGPEFKPSHFYYFATPFIATAKRNEFSLSVFRRFCDYYVDGFLRTLRDVESPKLKGVFYPSSVFVDEPPPDMGEYAAAKMAGEMLCSFLSKTKRSLVILKPRLPRMATDQTVGFIKTKIPDPVPVLLEQLRLFRDSDESKVSPSSPLPR